MDQRFNPEKLGLLMEAIGEYRSAISLSGVYSRYAQDAQFVDVVTQLLDVIVGNATHVEFPSGVKIGPGEIRRPVRLVEEIQIAREVRWNRRGRCSPY